MQSSCALVTLPLMTVAPGSYGGKIISDNSGWGVVLPLMTVVPVLLLILVSRLSSLISENNRATRSCFNPLRIDPLFNSSAYNWAIISVRIQYRSSSPLFLSSFLIIISCSSIICSDVYSYFSIISLTFSRQGRHEHGSVADTRDGISVFLVLFTWEKSIVSRIV